MASLASLAPLLPTFLAYLLSFVYVGIYWNNHHHLFQAAERVTGAILWANLHLLFWLSLVPFATHWMGESHFSTWPVATYGVVLFMNGLAFSILVRALIGHHGRDSVLSTAIGNDAKGKISLVLYVTGIATAFAHPLIACVIYCLVAVMWLVPDPRIRKALTNEKQED